MEDMSRISVFLADDNENILAHVRTVLGPEFEIVGTAKSGIEAVAEVKPLKPDVLVIDMSMPILNGLEVVARLGFKSETRFVFLTVHKGEDFVAAAFAAGASGYVAKAEVNTDLIPAIMQALAGGKFVSQSIASSS
jgi:DNA-binding NarL/FixJ family response regulator